MSFFTDRKLYQEWWLGISRDNTCGTTYKHGDLCHMITVINGIGAHSSGGTYSSLNEWKNNRTTIENHLNYSGASWFLPFFKKGINSQDFSEEEILNAFKDHFGFDPVPVTSGDYPVNKFQ